MGRTPQRQNDDEEPEPSRPFWSGKRTPQRQNDDEEPDTSRPFCRGRGRRSDRMTMKSWSHHDHSGRDEILRPGYVIFARDTILRPGSVHDAEILQKRIHELFHFFVLVVFLINYFYL